MSKTKVIFPSHIRTKDKRGANRAASRRLSSTAGICIFAFAHNPLDCALLPDLAWPAWGTALNKGRCNLLYLHILAHPP